MKNIFKRKKKVLRGIKIEECESNNYHYPVVQIVDIVDEKDISKKKKKSFFMNRRRSHSSYEQAKHIKIGETLYVIGIIAFTGFLIIVILL